MKYNNDSREELYVKTLINRAFTPYFGDQAKHGPKIRQIRMGANQDRNLIKMIDIGSHKLTFTYHDTKSYNDGDYAVTKVEVKTGPNYIPHTYTFVGESLDSIEVYQFIGKMKQIDRKADIDKILGSE